MLKFKEIRNSIINKKDKSPHLAPDSHPTRPPARSPLAFKKNHQIYEKSPIQQQEASGYNPPVYETEKKKSLSPLNTGFCHSDFKENSTRNGGNQTVTFSHLSQKKLEFNYQIKRKMTCQEAKPKPNIYTDQTQYNTPTKSNLSFASLLQSKKASNSKYQCSDRKDDRESSISKLKDKLFSMKKVISEKEKEVHLPVTPTKKKECQTLREMAYSPYQPTYTQEDIVKISIKCDSMSSELDMSPYLS